MIAMIIIPQVPSKFMWPKHYKNYPEDTPLIKEKVYPGKGIIGCEMHEVNGWGDGFHIPKPPKPGLIRRLYHFLRKKNA